MNGEDEAKRKLAELLKGTHKKRDVLSEEKEPREVEESLSKKQGDERYLLDERGSVRKFHLEEPIRRIIETFPGERVYINDAGGYYTVDYVEDALQEIGDTLCGGALGTYLKGQGVGNLPAFGALGLRDTGTKIGYGFEDTAEYQGISVGFKPSVVIFVACDSTPSHTNLSWGFINEALGPFCICLRNDGAYVDIYGTHCIYIQQSGVLHIEAAMYQFNDTGFILYWTKTGTIGCYYIYLALP